MWKGMGHNYMWIGLVFGLGPGKEEGMNAFRKTEDNNYSKRNYSEKVICLLMRVVILK